MTTPPRTTFPADIHDPIRSARAENKRHYRVLLALSLMVNLLMLTGPLYMLNVYDRVLSSRSVETLVALSLIAALLTAAGAGFDLLRARLLHRLGARLQQRLEGPVFAGFLAAPRLEGSVPAQGDDLRQGQALADLDSLLRHENSPAALARHDLPFAALFLALLFAFHSALGLLALATMAALLGLALQGRWRGAGPQNTALAAQLAAERHGAASAREHEVLRGLAMEEAAARHWQDLRAKALGAQVQSLDITATTGALMRGIRLGVQSAMLGLGAYLVLQGAAGGGVMISASILLGRALAPIEVIAAHWPQIRQAQAARMRLNELLSRPLPPTPMPLPPPRGHLQLQDVTLRGGAKGQVILAEISLSLPAGSILQVMGPSGAGKSALLRAIAQIQPISHGRITLDGAEMARMTADHRRKSFGYMPQKTVFFAETIARDIARLSAKPESAAVIAAARRAGAHDMILALQAGYETTPTALSGGQAQRVALARALFGNPALLLLDEPDAHLDAAGCEALRAALASARAAGTSVVLVSHDFGLTALCDQILWLESGRMRLLGPRAAVLRHLVEAAGTLPEQAAS